MLLYKTLTIEGKINFVASLFTIFPTILVVFILGILFLFQIVSLATFLIAFLYGIFFIALFVICIWGLNFGKEVIEIKEKYIKKF